MRKRTTSIVVAIGLIAVAGCSKKAEEGTTQRSGDPTVAPTPPPPEVEPPKKLEGAELAEKYKGCVGLLNTGKLDDFRKDCVAENYVAHDVATGGAMQPKGADQLIEHFKQQRTGFPDLKIEPQIVGVSGRNIISLVLMRGTNSGPIKGPMGEAGELPPTNKAVGLLMFHRLLLDDANKAAEEWAYIDPATMLSQLGMMPKEAPPLRPAMDKGLEGAPMVVVTADDAKEKANIEVVKKVNEAFNTKKHADAWALYAPDAVVSDQAGPKDETGLKEIQASAKLFFSAFPDANINIENTWAAGDYVFTTGKFTGTNTGDMGPKLKKTGKAVNLDYAEIHQLEGGKIARVWRFHSGAVFAEQLGLAPKLAPPGAAPQPGGAAPAPGGAAPAPAPGSAAPAMKEPAKEPAKP